MKNNRHMYTFNSVCCIPETNTKFLINYAQYEINLFYNFSKEDIKMINKHMIRCLAKLITKEMQIKTIMRYYFTSTRIAIILKIRLKTSVSEDMEKLEPSCTADMNVTTFSDTLEKSLAIPQRVNIELLYDLDPAIPLLNIHSREIKTSVHWECPASPVIRTMCFHCHSLLLSQKL